MSTRRPAAVAPEDSDTIEQLREELRRLQEAMKEMKASSKDPKVQPPNKFDGTDSSQLPTFLFQLGLVFDSRPSAYPTEKSKVNYAMSFLAGHATIYVQQFAGKEEPPLWLSDFSSFASQLKNVFGNPDVIGDTSRKLRRLQQTDTVTAYAANFRLLAGQLEWNNQALVSQFLEGLSYPIQRELTRTVYPKDLEELIDHAVRVDNLLQNNKKRLAQPNPFSPVSAAKPGQRLTEQQKEFRRKNNLCLYCGDAGHLVRNCPARPARPNGPQPPTHASEAALVPANPPGKGSAQPF